MIKWIKAFFAVDNTVNEHTVMGVGFFIVTVVTIWTAPIAITTLMTGSCLTCFGLALKK